MLERGVGLGGLALAVGLSVLWMAQLAAPTPYPVINLGALATAVAGCLALARMPGLVKVSLVAAPLLAAAALLWGADIAGVQRWIGIGGFRLHAAMLAGPAFAAALVQARGWLPLVCSATLAVLLALQPDRGTLIALCMVLALTAAARRDRGMAAVLFAALALLAAIWLRPEPLAPVRFVEGVVQDLIAQASPLAFAVLAALALAILLPLRHGTPGRAFAAWHAGLIVASLTGPYPTPLVGYGASAVIGYGLGWALLGGRR